MTKRVDVTSVTIGMLILKAVSLGDLRVYGILLRIHHFKRPTRNPASVLVSGALPTRAPGADCKRVGRVRQQPQSQVLPVDISWPTPVQDSTRNWNENTIIIAGNLTAEEEGI